MNNALELRAPPHGRGAAPEPRASKRCVLLFANFEPDAAAGERPKGNLSPLRSIWYTSGESTGHLSGSQFHEPVLTPVDVQIENYPTGSKPVASGDAE